MENILNLLSEQTFIEKMDMMNSLLRSIATQMGAAHPPFDLYAWPVVQQLVRMGLHTTAFHIGDQLKCNHNRFGELVWDVIGLDHDTPSETQYTHSMTLGLHDCLNVSLAFDAAEPSNEVANRRTYGSNVWKTSNIRQWLNSDKPMGEWFSPQTDTDVAPSYANTNDGFLYGLDNDLKSIIGSVKKITALGPYDGGGSEQTEDKVFILSKSEVYAGAENGISEGEAYPYYINGESASMKNNDKRKKKSISTFYFLRTPVTDQGVMNASNPYLVRYSTGEVQKGDGNGNDTVNRPGTISPTLVII